MKNILAILLSILLFNVMVFAQSEGLKSVVQAELNFAKLAADKNTRAAFLASTSDEGLVFNPEPVNAKESFEKRPENAALLAWQPLWADISSNGTLAYTTGDWQYSKTKDEKPVAFGTFCTIWQKQTDNNWKFLIDFGISHDKPTGSAGNWQYPKRIVKPIGAAAIRTEGLEENFTNAVSKQGKAKAYAKFLSDEPRILREGQQPFVGKKTALKQISAEKLNVTFKFLDGKQSGTLAYSYGTYEAEIADGKDTERGYFLHIWKLSGKTWQIALEVMNNLPKEKN